MTSFLDQISGFSPKRLALLAAELKARLDAAQTSTRTPIAVVGLGCRLPGAPDPAALWRLLHDGRDAVREVPPDRWAVDDYYDPDPDRPGAIAVREGAFLDRIDAFEPEFFGISPREAASMDPQQRLALEVAWEALEHAGIAPSGLAGSATGVFLGISGNDYQLRLLAAGPAAIDAHLASGNAHGVASGRIAYVLGLQGPALSIDTACSASMVSLHCAWQSLRAGECHLAIAGGVNVICAPEAAMAASRSRLMAADGRCKTFDATGDGYGRGEGCAMVVLKRLADAERDGDRILAVITGSALNQDGRSTGLTVPNGPAQEAVIRAALATAGAAPADIDYVEAHGSGTSLGDPIEIGALANVLSAGRAPASPLLVGSIKTNVGHLEAAAGIAGFLKVVLALQHEEIPPHLHFATPNPFIDWDRIPVRVPTRGVPWLRGGRVRRAGVSSFGFSGTNAHVIVEEAPASPARADDDTRPFCLPLSARTDAALRALAAHYADAVDKAAAPVRDVAHTAAVGRAHLAERAAVVAADGGQAAAALRALSAGTSAPALHRGRVATGSARDVVFLYTGAGAQYPGMGQRLYESAPAFRDTIDRCDALLGPDAAGRTLKTVLFPGTGDVRVVHEMRWTQPALFAVECAMTELWGSWGVQPAAVIGHSTGEYAAAWAAGVFTLEDALGLVAQRARLLDALPPGGAMATIFAPVAVVAPLVAPFADRLGIAAVNAPEQVVISGETSAVDAVVAALEPRGIEVQRLLVPLAAHSPLVEPALAGMYAAASRVTMRAPVVPLAWNLPDAAPAPGTAPDATYWRRHMREAVAFADGAQSLFDQGSRVFLEVGPHPALATMVQATVPADRATCLASLRRGQDDWLEIMAALAGLYVRGVDVDWPRVQQPHQRRVTTLPTYPFERRSFWVDPAARARAVPRRRTAGPLLLGRRLSTAETIVELVLSPDAPSWLGQHRVHGTAVVPGPVLIEMAQAALQDDTHACAREVLDLRIVEALVLPDEGRVVQVHVSHDAAGVRGFSVQSRPVQDDRAWTLHATGRLATYAHAEEARHAPALATFATRLGPQTDCAAYYQRLLEAGIEFGAAFRCLEHARLGDREALAQVVRPAALAADVVAWSHPALVDASLQVIGLALSSSSDGDDVHLLSSIDACSIEAPLPDRFRVHARLEDDGGTATTRRASVTLFSLDGAVLGTLRGVALARAADAAVTPHAYAMEWHAVDIAAPATPSPGRCVVVDDAGGVATAVVAALEGAGVPCDLVSAGDAARCTADQLAERLRGPGSAGVAWVIDCAASGLHANDEVPRQVAACALRHVRLAQALDKVDATAGLCLLTRGAQVAIEGDVADLVAAAAIGLSRTVGMERVGRALRLDLEAVAPLDAAAFLDALRGDIAEVAIRGGRRFVPQCLDVPIGSAAPIVREDGTYVITGGSGALGHVVARWLAERGAGDIVLLSRAGVNQDTLADVRRHARPGALVRTAAVDVGDRDGMDAMWRREIDGRRLRGIVHAAGILDDAPLAEQDERHFDAVARAKIDGGWHLHQRSVGAPLDFFVLFSSATAWLGTPGQANYAAANAFLDGLAHYRRGARLPATVISWGPWDDGHGMAARAATDLQRRWRRQGIGLLAPADGMSAIADAIATSAPPLLVTALNPARFVAQAPPHVRQLFAFRGPAGASGEDAGARDLGALLRDAATEDARRALVRDAVRRRAARVLGLDTGALDDGAPLAAYGLDSLMAVQLKNALQREAGVTLGVPQVLRSPSLAHLIDLVLRDLDARAGAPAAAPAATASTWEEGTL